MAKRSLGRVCPAFFKGAWTERDSLAISRNS